VLFGNAEFFFCDLGNASHFRFLRDFDIGRHSFLPFVNCRVAASYSVKSLQRELRTFFFLPTNRDWLCQRFVGLLLRQK
jgi:hypothetical protein